VDAVDGLGKKWCDRKDNDFLAGLGFLAEGYSVGHNNAFNGRVFDAFYGRA
jgi:hypothetical protein